MKLYVYVLEAKNLPSNGPVYLELELGGSKFASRAVTKGSYLDPVWNEEFVFRVWGGESEVLTVWVCEGKGDVVGRARVGLGRVREEENGCLGPTWFEIEEESGEEENCGKLLLALSLHSREDERQAEESTDASVDTSSPSGSLVKSPRRKKLMKAVASRLKKILHKNADFSRSDDSSDLSSETEVHSKESSAYSSFEEAMESMHSNCGEQHMPEDLGSGILLDQSYMVSPKDLNAILFSSDSQFRKKLAELQGLSDVHETPWVSKPGDTSTLTRVVTYIKPPSKLVKAVKAKEEQMYLKAGNGEFALLVNVKTPDVPYGNAFRVELLYKTMAGPELPSGEESSRLVVSWDINFCQSTMMRSMIEAGARQGLQENFDQLADLLSQTIKVVDSADSLEKDQVVQSEKRERQSNWKLGTKYFGNLTVVVTTFAIIYVGVHIMLCKPSKPQGLEINGLDLPDSFGELVSGGIIVLLLERIHDMVSHFIAARLQKGGDHGVEAKGDGWVVTVALVEAVNLPSVDATGDPDPYVVLTCNGKTRTSSVQLQNSNPQWHEILEFDATREPPSVLDVEVFDFDGPFGHAVSLGHTEINFLKHKPSELTDMWIPLEGKLAMSSHSKLHLRVFLEVRNSTETMKEFFENVEKGVGKKLKPRSPHKNSTFQKLFVLPAEEILIKDYSCYLRRKIPLQGRLFLSARVVGFYSNLFGHKTKFFFLWEDIEDVEVLSPSIASVGSPTLIITLRKDRGADAACGAKSQDEDGRLRLYFHSFASFDAACRTITALWRMRNLAIEDNALVIDESQCGQLIPETAVSPPVFEDANMSKIYEGDFQMKCLMELFNGGNMEHKGMRKSGCLNYRSTKWEEVKPGIYERQLSYKFSHHISVFGGEVNCTQRKTLRDDGRGWIVNQVMGLHDIPFGDDFHVHLRYEIEELGTEDGACRCVVFLGIEWLKSGKFQSRIERNINEKFTHQVKNMLELIKKDFSVNQ
ncbi:C2 and GRAM domain-containing protein [Drosera capensis]